MPSDFMYSVLCLGVLSVILFFILKDMIDESVGK